MKDGDNQQRKEVLMALIEIFPNAIEGGCGHHIVHYTWEKHVPGVTILARHYQDNYEKVKSKVQRWIYSWM